MPAVSILESCEHILAELTIDFTLIQSQWKLKQTKKITAHVENRNSSCEHTEIAGCDAENVAVEK